MDSALDLAALEEEARCAHVLRAAIEFALEADDGIEFLRAWNEGDYEACCAWDNVPEILLK